MYRYLRLRYYGSETVGERGQIQIPAEARRALGIVDGEAMVVVGEGKGHLMLVKAKMAGEFVSRARSDLVELQRQLQAHGEAAEETAKTS